MLADASISDLQLLLDSIGAPMFVVDVQLDERFVYLCANARTECIFGLSRGAYQGKTAADLLPSEQAQRSRERYMQCVQTREVVEFEDVADLPAGRIWLRSTLTPVLDAHGRVTRILGTTADVTQEKQALETLRYQHLLLQAQQELTPDGILVADVHGRYLSWNDRLKEMWGLDDELLRQGRLATLPVVLAQVADAQVYGDRMEALYRNLHEAVDSEELRLKDGRTFVWYSRSLADERGTGYSRIWYFRDISERKAEEQRLRALATTDPLTGLWNRRHFVDSAMRHLRRARQRQKPISVLMLDIDRFKSINDGHGHAAGDAVLQAVAGALIRSLRPNDLVCRWGGEEFAVVLPDTPHEAGLNVAERLRSAVEALAIPQGAQCLRVSISIGVSKWQPSEPDLEQAIRRADQALYLAKRAGRNRVRAQRAKADAETRSRRSCSPVA